MIIARLALLITLIQGWEPAINFRSLTQGVVYQDVRQPYFFQVNGGDFRFGIPTAYPLGEYNDVPQVQGKAVKCSEAGFYCHKYGFYIFLSPREGIRINNRLTVDGTKIGIKRMRDGGIIAQAVCDEMDEKGCYSSGVARTPYISYTYILSRAGYLKSISINKRSSPDGPGASYNLTPKSQELLKIG